MRKIRRALLSVANKEGITELGMALSHHGCEIFSTGGTLQALTEAGIASRDIGVLTQRAESFGGRIKTLSFETSSSILFDRERDAEEAAALGIQPIDLVACNFYPFDPKAPSVDQIDIGGPTMVRAAAKNFASVAVVIDPSDYPEVIAELESQSGALSLDRRKTLMQKAFNVVADYDAAIASGMDGGRSVRLTFTEGRPLRYGENPHQRAVWLRPSGRSLYDMEVLGGKELSYNNILDVSSAIEAVQALPQVSCAVVKHNLACGLAQGATPLEALELAWAGDPLSAFGSVLAFNAAVDVTVAEALQKRFVEAIVAPAFSDEALERLRTKHNLRILAADPAEFEIEYRMVGESLLVQTPDRELYADLKQVAGSEEELDKELIRFGICAVRQLRSNAITIVHRTESGALQLLGMGAGQPNRLTSVKLAVERAKQNGDVSEAILVSEAFFPFADSIELCAESGIRRVVQPGGAIRDEEVIEAAKRHNIHLIHTGMRHFKH